MLLLARRRPLKADRRWRTFASGGTRCFAFESRWTSKATSIWPETPLESKPKIDALPLKSVATLDYEERPLAPEHAHELSEVVAGERFYHEAKSSSVLNEQTFEKTLRNSLRHVGVRRETLPETLYSHENYFTQDELSLLRSPVSSLAVDHLLPREPIASGDRYEVDQEALCSVLNLTSIDSGSVESKVLEVTAKEVRFALDGEFEASVDGVATRIRLLGKMTFSREHSICTWLAMALHETREIGKSEPGFDIAATIRMVRRPMPRPVALPREAVKVSFGQPISSRKLFVELRCEEIEAGAMMPRSWKLLRDLPGSAVLRRIEHESNIAQCNLRTLVRLPEGSSLSLAEFQADVRRSLGDQLTRIDEGPRVAPLRGCVRSVWSPKENREASRCAGLCCTSRMTRDAGCKRLSPWRPIERSSSGRMIFSSRIPCGF